MLIGMAATFAVVATLAAVAGGWAVAANQYGRAAAILHVSLFGFALLFPALADRLANQPQVLKRHLAKGDGSACVARPVSVMTHAENQICASFSNTWGAWTTTWWPFLVSLSGGSVYIIEYSDHFQASSEGK